MSWHCKIYTGPKCPRCEHIKAVLVKSGLEFKEFSAVEYIDYLRNLNKAELPVLVFESSTGLQHAASGLEECGKLIELVKGFN